MIIQDVSVILPAGTTITVPVKEEGKETKTVQVYKLTESVVVHLDQCQAEPTFRYKTP